MKSTFRSLPFFHNAVLTIACFKKIYHNNSTLQERLTTPSYISALTHHRHKGDIPPCHKKTTYSKVFHSFWTMWNITLHARPTAESTDNDFFTASTNPFVIFVQGPITTVHNISVICPPVFFTVFLFCSTCGIHCTYDGKEAGCSQLVS